METIYTSPLFVLCMIIAGGLLLGNITLFGIRLGSSGVLFAGMIAGYFGLDTPSGLGDIGLVLFAYCIGLSAGSRFFRALARDGSKMAILSIIMLVVSLGLTSVAALLFNLPQYLSAGLFSGAMISTPALAAATENLAPEFANQAILGYGISYPFGIISVIIFVQILPKMFRPKNSEMEVAENENSVEDDDRHFESVFVEVTNSNLRGKNIFEYMHDHFNDCQVTRTLVNGRMVPLESEDTFEPGQKLLVFGDKRDLSTAIDLIGFRLEEDYFKDVEKERRRLILTNSAYAGKTVRELRLLQTYGVMITTIRRLGQTFIPNLDSHLELNDQIVCVGKPTGLHRLAEEIGHKPIAFEKTDIVSIFVGLTLGILVGHIPLQLPNTGAITLGLAGGPLITGLILGHFGRIGRIVGFIPRPVRMTLQEIGLLFFLAGAGVRSASGLGNALQSYGLQLILSGLAITLITMLVVYLAALYLFRFDLMTSMGAVCGNMRSSVALGNITRDNESQRAVVSYATSFPIAMILLTIAAKFSIWLFSIISG